MNDCCEPARILGYLTYPKIIKESVLVTMTIELTRRRQVLLSMLTFKNIVAARFSIESLAHSFRPI